MATYEQQKRSCGKKKCGRCGGTKLAHGPYWYAYWRDAKGNVRSRYMGKLRRPEWGKEEPGDPPPLLHKARLHKTRKRAKK